jgi:hypothetical protein
VKGHNLLNDCFLKLFKFKVIKPAQKDLCLSFYRKLLLLMGGKELGRDEGWGKRDSEKK